MGFLVKALEFRPGGDDRSGVLVRRATVPPRDDRRAAGSRLVAALEADDIDAKSATRAFAEGHPFLAAGVRLSSRDTIDRLLTPSDADASRSNHRWTRLGTLWLETHNVPLFIVLMRQLHDADAYRARRLLLSSRNAESQRSLKFRLGGGSYHAHLGVGSWRTVRIDPSRTIRDVLSGELNPIALNLAHELEHANLSMTLHRRLGAVHHDRWRNLEEVRVNAVENAFRDKLKLRKRRTYFAQTVPLHPSYLDVPAFPFKLDGEQRYLSPGEKLHGYVTHVGWSELRMRDESGHVFDLSLKTLEETIDGRPSLDYLGLLRIAKPATMLQRVKEWFDVVTGIEKEPTDQWRAAAKRNDQMTLTFGADNAINLHRYVRPSDKVLNASRPRDAAKSSANGVAV